MKRRTGKIIFTAVLLSSVFCLAGCEGKEQPSEPDSSAVTVTEIPEDVKCTSFTVKGKDIALTDDMKEKLSEFFRSTDTMKTYDLELAIEQYAEISFSSGSTIILGDNDDNIVFYRKDENDKGKLISISKEFKNYINTILNENNQ